MLSSLLLYSITLSSSLLGLSEKTTVFLYPSYFKKPSFILSETRVLMYFFVHSGPSPTQNKIGFLNYFGYTSYIFSFFHKQQAVKKLWISFTNKKIFHRKFDVGFQNKFLQHFIHMFIEKDQL